MSVQIQPLAGNLANDDMYGVINRNFNGLSQSLTELAPYNFNYGFYAPYGTTPVGAHSFFFLPWAIGHLKTNNAPQQLLSSLQMDVYVDPVDVNNPDAAHLWPFGSALSVAQQKIYVSQIPSITPDTADFSTAQLASNQTYFLSISIFCANNDASGHVIVLNLNTQVFAYIQEIFQ